MGRVSSPPIVEPPPWFSERTVVWAREISRMVLTIASWELSNYVARHLRWVP